MAINTPENAEKLANKVVEDMDLKDLLTFVVYQLQHDYSNDSDLFQEDWDNHFGVTMSKVTYICSYCGSDDIGIEAHCKWSVEEQRVEAVEMCDKGHTCGRCGEETSLKEVELDE